LPDTQYIGLLRTVDAILVLTTRDHTLQLGGCEAVSVGKPLIVSDWPYLRQFFSKGAVYVSNTAEGIYRGMCQMQQQQHQMQQGVLDLRRENRQEWEARLGQLNALFSS
jgi:hypothetical protein